jgi:hypothetical protein
VGDAPHQLLPSRNPSMKTKSFFQRLSLVMLVAIVAACADAPTHPATPAIDPGEATPIIGTLLGAPDTVIALRRLQPLASTITVSKTIGLFGGTLSIPAAGASIYFPPGALLRSTKITMSAPAGSVVAYEFGPHGSQFLLPPVITQSLSGVAMTGVDPSGLVAAYFSNLGDVNLATGVSLVTELLNLTVSLGNKTVHFPVGHFSGYLIAMGYDRGAKMPVTEGAQ